MTTTIPAPSSKEPVTPETASSAALAMYEAVRVGKHSALRPPRAVLPVFEA